MTEASEAHGNPSALRDVTPSPLKENRIDWTAEPQKRNTDEDDADKENEDRGQYVPPVRVLLLKCHLCPQEAATEEVLLDHLRLEHNVFEYLCFASSRCGYSTLKL